KGVRNMKLTYRQDGDYLVPNLKTKKQPEGEIGKYGMMRETYLMENKHGWYSVMNLEGTLRQHLMDIDKESWIIRENIIKQLLKENPGPSKEMDQMGWVRHQNSLIHQAEEVILHDLIYN
ncbi:MAG: TnpV protein, partial [Anaerovoracaceae bacterium]